MTIPLPLETERLSIRAFEAADVDAMAEVYGDPEVMRHVCLGVLDRDGTSALLEEYRRVVYEPSGEPELGYTLAASVWGRGYGLEAARACVDAAFAQLPHRRLVAKVEVDNERSLRLAQRLGMRRVGAVSVDGHPHVLLALDRS